MIPVSVITGFLGSGKTTLLKAVLRDPAYAGSAVIVNEWGEVGLDHELLETSGETLMGLSNGCLCCAVRGDLARTLLDLALRREAGTIPRYARVLIETSGLADPGPILHTLLGDPAIAERHRVEAVVTVVDALLGAATIARHPEAAQQVALADRLLISKTDLAPDTSSLDDALAALNPGAPRLQAVQGAVPPDALFASAARPDAVEAWLRAAAAPARHTTGVATISIQREAPLPAVVLPLFLEALAEHAGEKLLRLKGIVAVAEAPDRPAVIHGVRHVLHPVQWLDAWPSEDRRSRLVLIGQGIPRWWPARLLDALEDDAAR